jgi:hypothetical protein
LSVSIAMVALGKGAKISAGKLSIVWRSTWPASPLPSKPVEKDHTIALKVGKADVIYGLMPAPIPWSDLEESCAASWIWPDATEQLRPHAQHVVVTVSSDADPVKRAKLLTQATSALLACCDGAIGVYWPASTVVIPSKMFQDFAVKMLPDHPTTYIWVDFRAEQSEEEKTIGFTRGLSELGLMDMESRNSPEQPDELRYRFSGLATYLIENDQVIKNGDTIGQDEEELIRIEYVDSSFGHPEKVMRLDYESSEQSGAGSIMTVYGMVHAIATVLVTLLTGVYAFSALSSLISSVLIRILVVSISMGFGGFILLVVSDKILNRMFGLQAFRDD